MFQPNSTTTREEDINADDITLNLEQEFPSLDSITARDDHIEAELQRECQRSACLLDAFEKDSGIITMCP